MSQRINTTQEWKALQAHRQELHNLSIKDIFQQEPGRSEAYSGVLANLFVDYSRHHITSTTLSLLTQLADAAQLDQWRDKFFSAEQINISEQQAATHFAWRNPELRSLQTELAGEYAKVTQFAQRIRNGEFTGATGQPITHVVSLGIGGSHIGNQMLCTALQDFIQDGINLHFVDIGDSRALDRLCLSLPPEQTLCIVISKSFSTPETQLAFATLRSWLEAHYGNPAKARRHCVAVSSNQQTMAQANLDEQQCFSIPHSVGGRYSIWSSAALPTLIAIGCDHFEDFLRGGYEVDTHFMKQPWRSNLPVLLGLVNLWYSSFCNTGNRAVLVYEHLLKHLPQYLQQLEMESNGKSVTRDTELCAYPTAPVIWGGDGLHGQHSFFQLLHQGTQLIPCEFVLAVNSSATQPDHANLLVRNFFAQIQALTMGQADDDPHRNNRGNCPVTVMLMREVSPATLGTLTVLFEHQVFVQAMIWGINPFDQCGVELGKKIAQKIAFNDYLSNPTQNIESFWPDSQNMDVLLQRYKDWRKC